MRGTINTDGFEGYARRALERARKLDRREPVKPEITITFDDPLAMAEVLTAARLRLVAKVTRKASSITALAAALKRDTKSVRRDVRKLERAGVVRTREQINPGHGRVKLVEPVARQYRLTAIL
jgi:predicted transcriptional regulator